MNALRFEMVRRPYGLYAWRLVESRDGGRRVMARGAREYRSRKKVRGAIAELCQALPGATVVDTTRPYEEPETEFEVAPDVFPLPVDASAVDVPAGGRQRSARRPARSAEDDEDACEATDGASSTPAHQVSGVGTRTTGYRTSLRSSVTKFAGAAAGLRAAGKVTRWAIGKARRRRSGAPATSDVWGAGGSAPPTADDTETRR